MCLGRKGSSGHLDSSKVCKLRAAFPYPVTLALSVQKHFEHLTKLFYLTKVRAARSEQPLTKEDLWSQRQKR